MATVDEVIIGTSVNMPCFLRRLCPNLYDPTGVAVHKAVDKGVLRIGDFNSDPVVSVRPECKILQETGVEDPICPRRFDGRFRYSSCLLRRDDE